MMGLCGRLGWLVVVACLAVPSVRCEMNRAEMNRAETGHAEMASVAVGSDGRLQSVHEHGSDDEDNDESHEGDVSESMEHEEDTVDSSGRAVESVGGRRRRRIVGGRRRRRLSVTKVVKTVVEVIPTPPDYRSELRSWRDRYNNLASWYNDHINQIEGAGGVITSKVTMAKDAVTGFKNTLEGAVTNAKNAHGNALIATERGYDGQGDHHMSTATNAIRIAKSFQVCGVSVTNIDSAIPKGAECARNAAAAIVTNALSRGLSLVEQQSSLSFDEMLSWARTAAADVYNEVMAAKNWMNSLKNKIQALAQTAYNSVYNSVQSFVTTMRNQVASALAWLTEGRLQLFWDAVNKLRELRNMATQLTQIESQLTSFASNAVNNALEDLGVPALQTTISTARSSATSALGTSQSSTAVLKDAMEAAAAAEEVLRVVNAVVQQVSSFVSTAVADAVVFVTDEMNNLIPSFLRSSSSSLVETQVETQRSTSLDTLLSQARGVISAVRAIGLGTCAGKLETGVAKLEGLVQSISNIEDTVEAAVSSAVTSTCNTLTSSVQSIPNIATQAVSVATEAAQRLAAVPLNTIGELLTDWSQQVQCPSMVRSCCSFFKTWNWGTWDACGDAVLNAGRELLELTLNAVDWLTDPTKALGYFLDSKYATGMWQMWNWSMKSLDLLFDSKGTLFTIIDALVQMVLSMFDLFLAIPKVVGCIGLDSSRAVFTMWSGAFIPNDCGAVASITTLNIQSFLTKLGQCLQLKSSVPHDDGTSLWTPFLRRHDVSMCTYHIPPILLSIVDGVVTIVKALVDLFFAIMQHMLDGVFIMTSMAGDALSLLCSAAPAMCSIMRNGQQLLTLLKTALNGEDPNSALQMRSICDQNGKCLQAVAADVRVRVLDASSTNQRWAYSSSGQLKSESGLCMAVLDAASQGKVSLVKCVANDNRQQWDHNANTGKWANRHTNTLCLDSTPITAATTLYIQGCGQGNPQHWTYGPTLASAALIEGAAGSAVHRAVHLSEEQDEKDAQDSIGVAPSRPLRAAIQAELEKMMGSVSSSSAAEQSTLEAALIEERELTAVMMRRMALQQRAQLAEHEMSVGGHHDLRGDGSEHDDEENADIVDIQHRWAALAASSLDLESHADSVMSYMLAESSDATPTGFVLKIGLTFKCVLNAEGLTNPAARMFQPSFLTASPVFAIGFTILFGQQSKAAAKFSMGLNLAFSMGNSVTIEIGGTPPTFPESASVPCDVSQLATLSVTIGYTGAACMEVAELGSSPAVSGWSWKLTLPQVIKKIAFTVCSLVGAGVACEAAVPGDLISLVGGYLDLKDRNAWYIVVLFNPISKDLVEPAEGATSEPPVIGLGFGLKLSWSIFFGIPCGLARSSSSLMDMAGSVRRSLHDRLQAQCADGSAGKVSAECVGSTSDECLQQHVSARLACGGSSHLEALGTEAPVVDSVMRLQLGAMEHGKSASTSGFGVRVTAGWISGLSTLRPVPSSSSSSSSVELQSEGPVALRQVCLEWSTTEAREAFSSLTGQGLTSRHRARQMMSVMESKVKEDSSSKLGEWATFLRQVESMHGEADEVTAPARASVSVMARTKDSWSGSDARRCFKVRVGSVSATVLLGAKQEGGVSHSSHPSLSLSSFAMREAQHLASQVEHEVLSSASATAAVEAVLAAVVEAGGPSELMTVARPQLHQAIATEVGASVEKTLGTSLCPALSRALCPECAHNIGC